MNTAHDILIAHDKPICFVKHGPSGRVFVPLNRSAARRCSLRAESNVKLLVKLEEGASFAGRPVIEKMRSYVNAWVGSFDSIETAALFAPEFQMDASGLSEYLRDARLFAMLHGMFQLYDLPRVRQIVKLGDSVARQAVSEQWIPIQHEEAIADFQRRRVLTRDQFDLLDGYQKRGAVTAARMTAETIESTVKTSIMRALEEGTSLSELKKVIGEVAISPAHAENIFRTNVQSAYNTGHAEVMTDPRLEKLIPAWRFHAIVDDRTTVICLERDGLVFLMRDMEATDSVPPLHYMCRSTISAVMSDEWDGKVSDFPQTPSMEGFGEYHKILPRESYMLDVVPETVVGPIVVEPVVIQPVVNVVVDPLITIEPLKRFRELVPGYSPKGKINETMSRMRSWTKQNGRESGVAYTHSGQIGPVKTGTRDSVFIARPAKDSFTMVHTHPARITFSPADIAILLSDPMADTSVVMTDNMVYVLFFKGAAISDAAVPMMIETWTKELIPLTRGQSLPKAMEELTIRLSRRYNFTYAKFKPKDLNL